MNKLKKLEQNDNAKVQSFFKWYLYLFEKSLCCLMLFIMIPGYYLYLVIYMQPFLVQAYNPGIASRLFNIAISTFGVINIAGNLIMSLITNVKLKYSPEVGNAVLYCRICKVYCPEKAWHCRVCNVCIVNRDHHCTFFGKCIGLANLRHYILYLAYIFCALTYYNYHFYNYLSIKYDKETPFTLYETIKIILQSFLQAHIIVILFLDNSATRLEILVFCINFILILLSFLLFCFHGTNLLRGVTAYEASQKPCNYSTVLKKTLNSSKAWKSNIIRVFGTKWYLTFVWPFVDSPLPACDDVLHTR